MVDKDDMQQYYQRFLVLSKPLVQSRHLTDEEHDMAFWCGFHPDDQALMRPRLIAQHPHHPTGQPFSYKDVLRVARAEFQGESMSFPIQDHWEQSLPP